MKSDNSKEILSLVDETGRVVGSATRGECHGGSMLLHSVVHLHLMNAAGDIYLQKRPEWKDIQPGKWDTAVGGHVDFGESVPEALHREVREEIGLEGLDYIPVCSYVFASDRERELVNVHIAVSDRVPAPSDELDGGRFWPLVEIDAAIGQQVFTPNFESEYTSIIRPFILANHLGKNKV